jgi:SAM-dependent methyltransferase
MPFDTDYFDLIASNNGINNVQDITKTMKECYRVCKSKAQMVFTLNTQETMMEFYSVFQEVLEEESLEDEIKKMKAQIYLKRKPIEEIKTLTEDSGFTVKNTIYDSFELSFIDGTTMLNHYLIKYWFLDGWKKILNQNDLVRVFDKVESKLNVQSEIKGGFKLTIPFIILDCRRN